MSIPGIALSRKASGDTRHGGRASTGVAWHIALASRSRAKGLVCFTAILALTIAQTSRPALLSASPAQSNSTATDPDPKKTFDEALEAQKRGDYKVAEARFQELVKLHPEMTAAHANLGVVYATLGQFDEAIKEYQVALTQAPDDPGLRLNLGLAYYKKNDFAGAGSQFAALHNQDPDNVRIGTLLGDCLTQLGLTDRAISLYKAFEKANPSNLGVQWGLGTALIRAGDTREGLERIQKVAEEGQNAEAYQLAANLYLGLTYFDKAKSDAEAVLRLNPKAPKAHIVLGMVADYSGDQKGAEEEFKRALALDPTDLQARTQLASVFINQRKLDDARRELNRALEQDPNSYSALYLLGQIERTQGNLPAALSDFEKAAQMNPQWLLPHIELTALYFKLKRPSDGAREKKIVDQLRAEARDRKAGTRVILPQVPSQ
jgi:tetratricopeptide (TPR) repeat protein